MGLDSLFDDSCLGNWSIAQLFHHAKFETSALNDP